MVASRSAGTFYSVCRRVPFIQSHKQQISRDCSFQRALSRSSVRGQCRHLHATARAKARNEAPDDDLSAGLDQLGDQARLLAEAKARVVRLRYGNALPEGFLTVEEYEVYEKLFGPPESILQFEEDDATERLEHQKLASSTDVDPYALHHDADPDATDLETFAVTEEDLEENAFDEEPEDEDRLSDRQRAVDEYEDMEERSAEDIRAHPWTLEGRFGTYPSTIFLPKDTFIDPISSLLSKAPNKHLQDTAFTAFGGPNLPNSVATPSSKRQVLHQSPVALPVSQPSMEAMESYAFVAANMAGGYATATSIFAETRKRLGSSWLEGLLNRPGGPRILDAGSGGAAVLAWRDVLRAEWERLHPNATPVASGPPLGKSTVLVTSDELRSRLSKILQDTTFLPRLPDFSRPRDLPGNEEQFDPGARRHYDVIVAPHTLWHFREDWQRKIHIQNLWSLLDPKGGVLVIAEKGVPRGFELVAAARAMLLDQHIASPGAEQVETPTAEMKTRRHLDKEEGSIVAPCTNHGKCPMYRHEGAMKSRKDHCHFSQRFARPAFLQALHQATGGSGNSTNHEDVRFSYVVVRRGTDLRKAQGVKAVAQDESATLAAFEGYENASAPPSALQLPRLVLPPLKRTRHVVFDLCTPAATLERWTVTKSRGRQSYRDARKAQWGDLWALGAKTRILREARAGAPKQEPRRKRFIEMGVGPDGKEDTLYEVLRDEGLREKNANKKGKKGEKERKGRGERRRLLSEKEVEELSI